MSNAPQTFHNVTPDQFAQLQEKAAANGFPIQGNSGSSGKMGIEIAWNYSPETQQLTLHCTRSPFFVSVADINRKMHSLVTQALATV